MNDISKWSGWEQQQSDVRLKKFKWSPLSIERGFRLYYVLGCTTPIDFRDGQDSIQGGGMMNTLSVTHQVHKPVNLNTIVLDQL